MGQLSNFLLHGLFLGQRKIRCRMYQDKGAVGREDEPCRKRARQSLPQNGENRAGIPSCWYVKTNHIYLVRVTFGARSQSIALTAWSTLIDVEYQASIRQLTEINDKWIVEWRTACDVSQVACCALCCQVESAHSPTHFALRNSNCLRNKG